MTQPARVSQQIRLLTLVLALLAIGPRALSADLVYKTVEVYNTGVLGLKAWTDVCSGQYVNKADGKRGLVLEGPQLCSGYNRWKIRWDGDSTDRWSAGDWLRIVPPDLTFLGGVVVSPNPAQAGGNLEVRVTIVNNGSGNAGPCSTKILLLRRSPFAIIETYDHIETIGVASNQSQPVLFTIPLSSSLPNGTYYVSVEVDSDNTTGQTNYGNDVNQSGDFNVGKSYTITASADAGGTINPSGTVTKNAGEGITLSAAPNAGYSIDRWFLNGVALQNGGTEFRIDPIDQNFDVRVTFKQDNVTLYIDSTNGRVVQLGQGRSESLMSDAVAPPGTSFPKGSWATVQAIPNTGFGFSRWTGDIQSTALTTQIFMDSDKRISANFIIIAPPIQLSTANTTPQTIEEGSFSLSFLAARGWRFLISTTDNLKSWTPIALITKDDDTPVTFDQLLNRGDELRAYSRTPIEPNTDQAFLSFPLKGKTSATAKVFAMVDHHGGKDGVFRTLTGKTFDLTKHNGFGRGYVSPQTSKPLSSDESNPDFYGKSFLVGFMQDENGTDVVLPFKYEDDDAFTPGSAGIIWYDGHTGYDFGATTADSVLSAAEGHLVVSASRTCYNEIVLAHGPDEMYRTYYLHLSKWSTDMENAYARNEPFGVPAGVEIGNPGNEMCNANIPVHLHFTVKRKKWDSRTKLVKDLKEEDYEVVDPYGDRPCSSCDPDQPFLWLPGQ